MIVPKPGEVWVRRDNRRDPVEVRILGVDGTRVSVRGKVRSDLRLEVLNTHYHRKDRSS
jgi:hypothetical protein